MTKTRSWSQPEELNRGPLLLAELCTSMSRFTGRKRPAPRAVSRAKRTKVTTGLVAQRRDNKFRVPRNLSIVNFGMGFPKRAKMTHKYFEIATLVATGGAFQVTNYRANGMYDPTVAVGGHQPIYFDQMAAIYRHWVVLGSKITVTPVSTAPNGYTLALYLNDDASAVTTMAAAVEQSKSKFTVVQPQDKGQILTMGWSAKQTFGGDPESMEELQGTVAADPNEQSHFTIAMQPTDGVTGTTVQVAVQIEYIAVWSELADVESS